MLAQANEGNVQKTFHKTFITNCGPRLYFEPQTSKCAIDWRRRQTTVEEFLISNVNLTTALNSVPAAIVICDVAGGGGVHRGHRELPVGVAAAHHRPHARALRARGRGGGGGVGRGHRRRDRRRGPLAAR